MTITTTQLAETLKRLNWHFGRGDYSSFAITEQWPDKDETRGVFYRKVYYSPNCPATEQRRFVVKGKTVRALGHQMKAQTY